MRKKTRTKKSKQPSDDTAEKAAALIAGVALVAVFGGLGLAYGWKALVVGTPL